MSNDNILSLFQRNGTYSISILLYSTVNNKNFLQFKPTIIFQSMFEDKIVELAKFLNLSNKIIILKRKNMSTIYKLVIQGSKNCLMCVNNIFLKYAISEENSSSSKSYNIIYNASHKSQSKKYNLDYIIRFQSKKYNLDYIIKDNNTKKTIKFFYECLSSIEKYGATHSTWKDELVEIIDLKLEINKIGRTRPGFTKEEWIQKIKKHLEANK